MQNYQGVERFVHMIRPEGCVLCNRPLPGPVLLCDECEPEREIDELCPSCGRARQQLCICEGQRGLGGWAFNGAVCALRYSGKVRDAILRLRKTPDRRTARFFALEMAETFRALYPNFHFDAVTEIPHPPAITEKRGFSPDEMIAGGVAHLLKVPHRMRLLAADDSELVTQRYTVRINQVQGKHVLLVCDLMITGQSANACAIALTQAGASGVFVLAASAAGPPVRG